jgi:hypothetical protein
MRLLSSAYVLGTSTAQFVSIWSVQGSNLRPPGCKSKHNTNQSHQFAGL